MIAERSRGSYFFSIFLAQTPASFGPKSCFLVSCCTSPSCIANLNLLASVAAKINTGVPIFLDAPLARTPANLGPKSCFLVSCSPTPSPTCIPYFKLLASTVTEINRGSQFFGCSPSLDPANLGRKSCFSASYSPSPSCIPNLKLLALTVAEIDRGSQIFTCSPSPAPINFGPESFFGKLFPVPKLCKKKLAHCASTMTRTVCFEEKTTICNAKVGDLGDNGDRGSKYVVKNAIFGIANPDLPIHYATFMGLQ